MLDAKHPKRRTEPAGNSLLHQAKLSQRLRAEVLLLAVGLKAETFAMNDPVLTHGSCSAQGKGLQYYFALWNLFRA